VGDFKVSAILNDIERRAFYQSAVQDLEAFEQMLAEGLIDKGNNTIGVEQELCLVYADGNPAKVAPYVLENVGDKHYTNELALFNLEINLDPQTLTGTCFSEVENNLISLVAMGNKWAKDRKAHLFLAGILPTIRYRDLKYESMTPELRYEILSEELLKLRGRAFEIYLQGVDDFYTKLQTVLFEACNTSFQTHLQVNPENFVDQYNWAQMIAAPVMGVAANSPLLFGKELWAENRIALFKQSLDTRKHNHVYSRMPRVYFGNKWLTTSPVDIWREDLIRFPLIFKAEGIQNPMKTLSQGKMPLLRSIRLHNGTTYTWNRLCYGVNDNKAHIRLECRYMPAGPTLVDEVANFVLWAGVMKGLPEEDRKIWKETNFQSIKSNFVRAARTGIETMLYWKGKTVTIAELVSDELLPMAERGLSELNVNQEDISKYLGIIEKRLETNTNGATWAIKRFRKLKSKYEIPLACEILTQEMLEIQNANIPIHEYRERPISKVKARKVEDVMKSDIYRVDEDMTLSIAKRIMSWKMIHHLPVENSQGQLVGIVSQSCFKEAKSDDVKIKEVMHSLLITCSPECTLEFAVDKMRIHSIHSLLIMEDENLVGILTYNDLKKHIDRELLLTF
jgi:CBS domain-containing protein